MAVRKIVHIDEDLCDGCGDCVPSCAEGAIQIIGGKARLLADNLCDGLGACLGECPQGAITVEEREADEFDESAVEQHLSTIDGPAHNPITKNNGALGSHGMGMGCPGSRTMSFAPQVNAPVATPPQTLGTIGAAAAAAGASALRQWPVQLHLVSPVAPYFQGADVLLAADCVSFAMGDFHTRLLSGRSLAVACPKLDHGQEVYLEKLIAMITQARINTLTVALMEVPCCGGLLRLAQEAVARSGRKVPIKKVLVGVRGEVLAEDWV
ncbi:MAG TPA: ferredoxin [Candidatus Krumholzibacteria bacterium]|nr:ferredoxin [Candidatus Krumholzibacteria bacterium]